MRGTETEKGMAKDVLTLHSGRLRGILCASLLVCFCVVQTVETKLGKGRGEEGGEEAEATEEEKTVQAAAK